MAVFDCPPRSTDTWHVEDGKYVFYIRESNATVSLPGPNLTRYVRERWSA